MKIYAVPTKYLGKAREPFFYEAVITPIESLRSVLLISFGIQKDCENGHQSDELQKDEGWV